MNLLAPSRAPILRFDRTTLTKAGIVQIPVTLALALLIVVAVGQLHRESQSLTDYNNSIASIGVPNDKQRLLDSAKKYSTLLNTVDAERVGDIDLLVAVRDINDAVAPGVTISKITTEFLPDNPGVPVLRVEGNTTSTPALDASRRALEKMHYHVAFTEIQDGGFHATVIK